jgi:hypothetical protein
MHDDKFPFFAIVWYLQFFQQVIDDADPKTHQDTVISGTVFVSFSEGGQIVS